MHVSATKAKNQFGSICAQAKLEPVFVEKDGRVDSVILSAKQYADLCNTSGGTSMAHRRDTFEKTYAVWLAEQNASVDARGVWCDDVRVW